MQSQGNPVDLRPNRRTSGSSCVSPARFGQSGAQNPRHRPASQLYILEINPRYSENQHVCKALASWANHFVMLLLFAFLSTRKTQCSPSCKPQFQLGVPFPRDSHDHLLCTPKLYQRRLQSRLTRSYVSVRDCCRQWRGLARAGFQTTTMPALRLAACSGRTHPPRFPRKRNSMSGGRTRAGQLCRAEWR